MSDGQFSDYEEDISAKVKAVRFADTSEIKQFSRDCEDADDLDSDDYFYDSDNPGENRKKVKANSQAPTTKISSYQTNEKLFKKYENKINVDRYEPKSTNTDKLMEQNDRNVNSNRIWIKDKQDRATAEQVMDPRTRMILFKLLNKESKFKDGARPRDESPNSKKARKMAVKEAKAEKRKTKTRKHLKKRRKKARKR